MHGRLLAVVMTAALLVPVGCGAGEPPTPDPAAAAWCEANVLPDGSGGVSVAAVARDLHLASADVDAALARLEAEYANGAAITRRQVQAMAAGDTAAEASAAAEYRTWQANALAPLASELARAMAAWRGQPEYAEACATAYARRGSTAVESAAANPRPGSSAAQTAEPTEAATAEPTAEPTEVPGLTVGRLTYTSSTSVGRVIGLTMTVRNRGGASGRLTISVEGLGFTLKQRTPFGGCVPNCWGETGSDGLAYAQWTVPKSGASKKVTVQLRAKRAGSYRLRVRLFDKASGPEMPIGEWTVTVRVR